MRKTQLKKTTTIVFVTLFSIAVLLSIVRVFMAPEGRASVTKGSTLFVKKGCVQCHFTHRRETKVGPGLEGLFDREKLPASKRPVNEKNIRSQLKSPYNNMPSFEDRLTEKQIESLIEYLRTL